MTPPQVSQISIGRRIVFGVLGGTGYTIVSILVSIVQIRLIFDYLDKDFAGIWFLFLTVGIYISFFDLGVSPTLTREISFINGSTGISGEDKTRSIADLIATSQRIFHILASAVLLLALVTGGFFLIRLSPPGQTTAVGIAWVIFSIGASLNLLGGAGFASLYGMGDVATERMIRAGTNLLGLGLSALLLHARYGILGVSLAWVIQNALARWLGWKLLFRHHPQLTAYRGRFSSSLVRKIVPPSLKWAALVLGSTLILQTDNPIIAATMGVADIPKYEAAARLSFALLSFSMLIVTSSTPFLSASYAAGAHDEFRSLLFRNVRFGMSIMIISVSFVAVFGDALVLLWLGPGSFVGFPVIWTLLVMLTLEAHHVIHGTATMAAGHLVFLRPALISGALKIILSVFLARFLGLWGVALGTCIAQMLTNNWYAPYVAFRLFGLPMRSYARSVIVPLIALAGAMLAINWGIRRCVVGEASTAGDVVLTAILSGAAGAALALFLVLRSEERRWLLQVIRRPNA